MFWEGQADVELDMAPRIDLYTVRRRLIKGRSRATGRERQEMRIGIQAGLRRLKREGPAHEVAQAQFLPYNL
jgi:hypothetical protein